MKKKKYDEQDGVWRTIGGRRVFIRAGQDLASAMKESGKFKKKDDDEKSKKINETMDKRASIIKKLDDDTKDLSSYDKYNLAVSKLENEDYSSPTERQYWVGEKERYIKNQKDTHIETKKYQPKEVEYVGQDGETHKMDSYEYPKEREEYHKFLQDKYGTYKEEEIKDETGRTDYKKLRNEFYEKKELEDGLRKYIKDNFGTESEIYQRNYNKDGSTKTIEETRKYLNDKEKNSKSESKDEYANGIKLLKPREKEIGTYTEDLINQYNDYAKQGKGNNKTYQSLRKEIAETRKSVNNRYTADEEDILDRYSEDYGYEGKDRLSNLKGQIDYMRNPRESINQTAQRLVEGGDFLIYNEEVKDYLRERNIKFNDDNFFDKYKMEMAEKIERLYNQASLKDRYKGTTEYLQKTTNMSGAEILELLKKIDEDKR